VAPVPVEQLLKVPLSVGENVADAGTGADRNMLLSRFWYGISRRRRRLDLHPFVAVQMYKLHGKVAMSDSLVRPERRRLVPSARRSHGHRPRSSRSCLTEISSGLRQGPGRGEDRGQRHAGPAGWRSPRKLSRGD
jgi:hypothetical protein